MAAHRLIAIFRDVVDWEGTRAFYREFGLSETSPGTFASLVGGEQLVIEKATRAAVTRIDIAVESDDDLETIGSRLTALGFSPMRLPDALEAVEPITGITFRLVVAPPLPVEEAPVAGELDRLNVVPRDPIRPLRLGHIVLGCTDVEAGKPFFIDGLGMRLSDYVGGGPFMRFGRDHHNIVLTPAPFSLLHHTAWKVRNVDEIGYGGSQMIEGHPHRHAWGLGRHAASANYFWYLKDPGGAFAEYYYSDLDERAPDDLFWDEPANPPPLPIAAWSSPAFTDAPLRPPTPEEMPAPILEDALPG